MMRRYDSYKDSGVEWIGEIPSHWVKNKLKHISSIVTGNTPPTKDEENFEGGEYLWVKPNEINGFYPTNETQQKLTEIGVSLSRVVPSYSVFVNGIGRIGEFGYSDYPVSTNQQINSVVFCERVNKRFGIYLISVLKEGFLVNSEKVVVPILNKTKQENVDSFLPPLSEQHQIVSYLDTKTSQIDTLIEKTQRKIQLLKENRTSLINEVVTKGLNPNVEMKDSGVEWIGEIPSHWVSSKLKYDTLSPVQYGLNISGDKYLEEGIRFIRITDISESGKLNPFDGKYLSQDDVPKEFLLKKYDVLFCRSGTVGKTYLHLTEGLFSSGGYLVRFNFRNYSESKFIFYLSKTDFYWDWIKLNTVVSTIENVNGDKYQNFLYPKPPFSEQEEIVSYLDEHTQLIDKTISVEQRRIELLKEYRQSLISELVTGKRKVVTYE